MSIGWPRSSRRWCRHSMKSRERSRRQSRRSRAPSRSWSRWCCGCLPAAGPTSHRLPPCQRPHQRRQRHRQRQRRRRAAAPAGTPYTIDIPRIAEAAFGDLIYALVSGNVVFRETDNELRVRIRVSNFDSGSINFWDDSFRLAAGGQTLAPVSGLNEIVAGNSLQYGVVAFRIPRQTRKATLQIVSGRAVASIPIDLAPTGRPPVDEQAEIADSLSQAIRESVIKEATPLLSADGMTVTLDRASSRRFVNALRLILSVRVANSGTGPVFAGNIIMRVAVGDVIVVPVDWPFLAIDPQSMATENVAFDLPTSTTQATLRTTIGTAVGRVSGARLEIAVRTSGPGVVPGPAARPRAARARAGMRTRDRP